MGMLDQAERKRPDIGQILGKEASRFQMPQPMLVAGGAAIAAVVAVLLYWSLSGSSNTSHYLTAPAARGDLSVLVTATGSVQPTNEVDVSSELSGTIRSVLVDYNSPVKAGQALAELDTDKLKATVESSRAKLAAARARVKDAEATLEEKRLEYRRKEQLAERQISSTHDLEVAKATYERAIAALDSARAEVAAAAADLKLNETNLAKTCICSPINGVVLKRSVEPGQTVASNLQAPVLFTIAEDLTKMEVQVDVDEADVGKVSEGQPATFSVDAYPDKTFIARIRDLRFGSETVQGVVTYKAILTTQNADLLLRPGMTATAEIKVQEVNDGLLVPNTALRFSPPDESAADKRSFLQKLLPGRPVLRAASKNQAIGAERKIWVLKDGAAHAVPVSIGPSDGSHTQITSGELSPGDAVILDTTTVSK